MEKKGVYFARKFILAVGVFFLLLIYPIPTHSIQILMAFVNTTASSPREIPYPIKQAPTSIRINAGHLLFHILLVFNRFVTVPFQIFYADFTLVISNHVTRPAPPSPHARYRPKRGTPRCRCTPPHGCPHNASQNPSSCSPPVLFCRKPACTGRFPLPVAPCGCIIAHAASHKSDFQGFSGDFCTKNAPPSQKWEGGAWQVRLFSGAQWAAAYSGTTRPGCGASSARDFS